MAGTPGVGGGGLLVITYYDAYSFAAAQGTLTLSGKVAVLAKAIIALSGTFHLTGYTILLRVLIAPLNKFKIRLAKYVLQQVRSTTPFLGR